MYARVTISEIQPGRQDEAISISQDSIVPAARQRKGYRGYLGMVDRDTNKGITITLWDTETDMMSGDEGSPYLQEQMAKVVSLLAKPVVREHYEVTICEVD